MRRHSSQYLTVCMLAAGVSLTAATAQAQAPIPTDWDTAMPLVVPRDLNPDPRILEIDLAAYEAAVEISPGRTVKLWTYNGGLPGPLIRARVGDRLIVHFTNRLPAPTTVHWHGLQVPFAMDGVPELSQPEIKPGESFTYDFTLPDAGLFWYHPHVMSAAQVGFGLYGAFLVDDPTETFSVPDEHVMVLSDVDLTEKDVLESPETGGSAGMAFGREGNVLLINGREHPHARVRAGVPQRWRVVNAAKSRYFELDAGEGREFLKIGGDGGLQEYAVKKDTLVLTPGERADLFFTPTGEPGSMLPITAKLADRGYGSIEARSSEDILTLALEAAPAGRAVTLPTVARSIAPLDRTGATNVAIEFGIGQSPVDGSFEYMINKKTLGKFAPVPAQVGETQVWTITNTTAWSHPFHLHGFFFQVLDAHGEPVRPLEWKDTVNVPYKDKLTVVVRFDDRPGLWMFHCHVLDHADGGLMGSVALTRPGESAPTAPAHRHGAP